jgi:hypothetical protein
MRPPDRHESYKSFEMATEATGFRGNPTGWTDLVYDDLIARRPWSVARVGCPPPLPRADNLAGPPRRGPKLALQVAHQPAGREERVTEARGS